MKLHKVKDSDLWHITLQTESGAERTINTFCYTRDEAEKLLARTKLPEIEAAGNPQLRAISRTVS